MSDDKSTEVDLADVAGKVTKKTGADLKAVAKAMIVAQQNAAMEVFAVPDAALAPFVSPEERKAIESIVEVIEHVTVPSEVRKMELGEIANITDTRENLDAAEKAIIRTKEAIREAIFNHFDKVAEEQDLVDESTPRDAKGHYVLEDKTSAAISGLGKKFTREVSSGGIDFGTTAILADRLADAKAEGLISHADYLKATVQVRVLDEAALYEMALEDKTLYAAIRHIARAKRADSASLNLRDHKEQT